MMRIIIFVICLVLSPVICAQPLSVVLTGGYAFGGDTLADEGGKSLKAGAGLQGEIGLEVEPAEQYALRLLLGIKGNITQDGEIFFITQMATLSALAIIKQDKLSFGAGFTHHLNPKYKVDDLRSETVDVSHSIKFDDANGVSVLVGYSLSDTVSIEGRYTDITYETSRQEIAPHFSDIGGLRKTSYDANHLTVSMVILF